MSYATKEKRAAYQRQRVKANRENPPPPETVPHGVSGYTNFACRCSVCRDANAEQQRRLVARWREDGPASHGIAGYKAGCRCERCRAAKSVAAAAYRARKKARAEDGAP